MIPQLQSAFSDINVPAPPGFSPAKAVEWARLDRSIVQFPTKGKTHAQKAGIRYENQVQAVLQARFPEDYKNNPWISFRDISGYRRCRPDGLLVSGKAAIIFEIKIRHMPDAWWQLRELYLPVMRRIYPTREIRLCEIVREYDPSMPFPEVPELLNKLDDVWLRQEFPKIGVYIWKR